MEGELNGSQNNGVCTRNGSHGKELPTECSVDDCCTAENPENGESPISSTTSSCFKFSTSPNLEDIRQLQSDFVRERNWDQYHQPRNLLLALVGEVGEVSELFQWKGEVKEGLPDWSEKDKTHLAQELSDVLIYLVRLADKCHVDLPSAVLEKMALNKLKYPADKTWGCSKKYNEYD